MLELNLSVRKIIPREVHHHQYKVFITADNEDGGSCTRVTDISPFSSSTHCTQQCQAPAWEPLEQLVPDVTRPCKAKRLMYAAHRAVI